MSRPNRTAGADQDGVEYGSHVLVPSRPGLRPPAVSFPGEYHWVLYRAVGPRGRECAFQYEAALATRIADELLLTQRIAQRTPTEVLEADIGRDAAERMMAEFRRGQAIEIQNRRCAKVITEIAASREIDLVFLKGMALQLRDLVEPGGRPMADVDFLVAAERCQEIQEALIAHGWREITPSNPGGKHLGLLAHERFPALEVHRRIDRLSVSGDRPFLTFQELRNQGLLRPIPGMSKTALALRDDVQIAHMATHGLGQHWANSISGIRLLCDLDDLFNAAGFDPELADQARDWIVQSQIADELADLIRVVQALHDGVDASNMINNETPGGRVLGHFIALLEAPGYRDHLARRSQLEFFRNPAARKRLIAFWRPFYSRRRLERVLDRPMPVSEYLVWLLRRPFHLVRAAFSLARAVLSGG